MNCNTESKLAGWLFTNTNVFSQTNTLLSNCVCNCLMPLSLPQSYLVWLPCLWQNLTITPWTNYNGKCFDWLLVGYDMTVKIGPIPCPGWIGKSLLQWLFGNANHGPGRYSASSFVSQQKFSINKIPGLQQQARGLQAMSGSKFFSTEPKRRQGRPSKRWDYNLEKIAMNYFRMSWVTAARIRPEWQFFEQVYVQFCSSMWPMNPPNPCPPIQSNPNQSKLQ